MSLFAIFGLWETTVAVAAGAASIPIIIHLHNRKRFKIVTWAAMRFLLAAQKQDTRRMRLEQIILLAVRVLLLLLIILAMASVSKWMEEDVWAHIFPEGGELQKPQGGRTHRILVLDASLSMNLELKENVTCFDEARRLALQVVKSSGSGDGFNVMLIKDSPAWLVPEISQDSRKVTDVLT